MWDKIENRLALLELFATGRLPRRKGQDEAWAWLAELPWTRRTERQDEIAVVEARQDELRRLLNQTWPEWVQVQAELEATGLPVSEQGWRRLQDIKRGRSVRHLPARLNRRTALAHAGPHSKSGLSAERRQALQDTILTHDGIIRVRPCTGLRIRHGSQELDATVIAEVLGETVISERALAGGTSFIGTKPRTVLLVENLGPYLDVPVPHGWVVAHVPGWNTRTIRPLLEQWPGVPIVHFGDLDPNGVRIVRHLRTFRPDLRWAVPEFWREYIDSHGLSAAWPESFPLGDLPPLVRDLMAKGLWMEQETIALDPRLCSALEAASASTAVQ